MPVAAVLPVGVLALGALAIVGVMLAVILTNRLSPLAAMILVPVIGAILLGQGAGVPGWIIAGVTKIAPVAGMFVFAILFFGVVSDAGLLAPLVGAVLRLVGRKPSRITMGTALLALLIHLDGSGAVCFLITVPAMLPLYDQLGMDRRILACCASLAAGVNFLPWTGPTLRASAALHLTPAQIFTPMLPVQLVGLVFVFAAAWWMGRREERRLAALPGASAAPDAVPTAPATADPLHRPRLFWLNLAITLAVIALMVTGVAEPAVVFMVAFALVLTINYPRAEEQRLRIEAHARPAMMMAGVLFAAGAFTGIMNGAGLIHALAQSSVALVPEGMGRSIPLLVALTAMPLSVVFDPDSFYFGVLPVVAQVAGHFGVPSVQVAQAALLGMHTVGFPISPLTPATFLVAGLSRIELGAHQRFAFPWLLCATLVMTVAALAIGLIGI
ncbi:MULTISPECIES: citrate:proton symporter [unclassified Novosphingobium]|uniref:CitMHS family transporter n=1 Tax=unclassified Novosphingobium TaxID=2644732 RepID=UPI00146A7AE4|nr:MULTISPECIES: citrate:proton symporter [unclassified Novosphingobium]NMN04712.1 CitMHS family citrate-Mg2+:H+ or citrate-Ca2+:H+ symporter [Novosphingobium sp. SG919]NMN85294.1 CitMHS family citrate-Mg2+:H+ or citrate-Ca2+:H+ symporter [Novosphingobium sp. SG916]